MVVLDHLTAWELEPPALIKGAAQAGYDAVSLWFLAPPDGIKLYPICGDKAMRRETIACSLDSGIGIFSIGLFVLSEGGWQQQWDAMLESGAAMGAQRGIVLHYDPEPARARDVLAKLAEAARQYKIGVDVEFIAGSELTSLKAARDLVRAVGGGCGIILDPLHLQRTGGSPADIDAETRSLIRYAQLCDGPATMPPEHWLDEGSSQRQLTGDGEFPLRQFMASLPAGVPIGIEIPLSNLATQGIGPIERAQRALIAAKPYLALASTVNQR